MGLREGNSIPRARCAARAAVTRDSARWLRVRSAFLREPATALARWAHIRMLLWIKMAVHSLGNIEWTNSRIVDLLTI